MIVASLLCLFIESGTQAHETMLLTLRVGLTASVNLVYTTPSRLAEGFHSKEVLDPIESTTNIINLNVHDSTSNHVRNIQRSSSQGSNKIKVNTTVYHQQI